MHSAGILLIMRMILIHSAWSHCLLCNYAVASMVHHPLGINSRFGVISIARAMPQPSHVHLRTHPLSSKTQSNFRASITVQRSILRRLLTPMETLCLGHPNSIPLRQWKMFWMFSGVYTETMLSSTMQVSLQTCSVGMGCGI